MKKRFFILGLFFLGQLVFAQNADYAKDAYFSFMVSWHSQEYVTPEKIYSFCFEDDTYREIDRSSFYLDKSGYFYYGGSILIPGIPLVTFGNVTEETQTNDYAKKQGYFFRPYYKTQYTASSELIENTKKGVVHYKADNLGKFAYAPADKYESLSWNFEAKPWAVSGNGIGEKITLKTETLFEYLDILNGYVDLKKMDLYKKNSRAKCLKIVDKLNNYEYMFYLEDAVEFQKLNLRKKTNEVEITVLEVYPGEKWEDLCITGIVPDGYSYSDDMEKDFPLTQNYTFREDPKKAREDIKEKLKTYKKWVESYSEK